MAILYLSSRLQKGPVWKGLEIDSLYDIAVNKAQMFMVKPRDRDYIDLYHILQGTDWQVKKLFTDAKKKFGVDYNYVQVAKNFLKVGEITDFPKMLVPFDQNAMEKFYLGLAKSLKKEIFKK